MKELPIHTRREDNGDGGKKNSEETKLLQQKTVKNIFTVDEAIEHVGFGRFQIQLSIMCIFANFASAIEYILLSILGPVLVCEWQLDSTREALITTVVFCGFLIASPIIGMMSDVYGRRSVLGFTAAWGSFFGLLSGLSPSYTWLLLLRFLAGMGTAGVIQLNAYISEFLPQEARGKWLMLTELFFALGGSIEVLLARSVLQTIGWRWWVVLSSIPLALFTFLCIFIFPTSPRYQIMCGDAQKALETLQQMAKTNGKKAFEVCTISGENILTQTMARGNVTDLFSKTFCGTTILTLSIGFAVYFAYVGIVLFTVELIQLHDNSVRDSIETNTSYICHINCKGLSESDYTEMIWTALAEVPGIILTVGLIDKIGRRWTLGVLSAGYGICCFLLCIVMPHALMLIILFIARGMIAGAGQAIFVYTAEVYPTQLRGLAIGACYACSRIGVMCTPFIAQILLKKSLSIGLGLYGVLGIITAVAAILLPYETRDKELDHTYNN